MGIIVRDKKFPSSTGICDVRCRIWAPDEPHACVQLIHVRKASVSGLLEVLLEALVLLLSMNSSPPLRSVMCTTATLTVSLVRHLVCLFCKISKL